MSFLTSLILSTSAIEDLVKINPFVQNPDKFLQALPEVLLRTNRISQGKKKKKNININKN